PDLDYIESYRARGEIANSAGDGKCGYTARSELGAAYASLLTRSDHDGRTVNLNGEPISQTRLVEYLNRTYSTQLKYRAMPSAEYARDRIAELGPFMGGIIAGIYDGIRLGAFSTPGDFKAVTSRSHQGWDDYFRSLARSLARDVNATQALRRRPVSN